MGPKLVMVFVALAVAASPVRAQEEESPQPTPAAVTRHATDWSFKIGADGFGGLTLCAASCRMPRP